MSYIKDELGLINALIKSKDIGEIDKELLNRAVEYFSLVIKEKNILAKRNELERLVLSLTELIDDKLMELHFKKRTASSKEEVRKIDEVILELEGLKQTIIDNNKVYMETILSNLDSILDGEALLNECARIISHSDDVDPNVFTKGHVDQLFNDVYDKVGILSYVEKRKNIEKKIDVKNEKKEEKNKLLHLLYLIEENFHIIEEFINVIASQMKLKEKKEELLSSLSEVYVELQKLDNAIFKTRRVQGRINFLHYKIRRINEHVIEINDENAKVNQYINTLHSTLKIIGLGEVAHVIRYSNKTYDNSLNEIVSPLYDLRLDEKDNIFAIENVLDIVLLLFEQVNRNNKNNLIGDTTLIKIISYGNSNDNYPSVVTNLELSCLERKLLNDVMQYLNNITISDGKLVIDGTEDFGVTSEAIATLLLKVIVDINGDVLLEDLPEYIKIKSNMQEIEVWYKEYIQEMYDDTVDSINAISGVKKHTLNGRYNY